ncbi:MAG TPA: TetR/AcrR family transcriptional regulator [Thermoleophilaceae bacterium]
MSNRDALLEGAKRCLREKGYANTTARDLVAASGTNLSSIGYHFGSKEALLAEAFDEAFAEWTAQLNAVALDSPAATALDRVAASWKAMLDMLPEHERLMLAFVESIGPSVRSPELRARLAEHYERTRTDVSDVVKRTLGEDALEAGADPDVVASYLIAVADGFMIQFLIDPSRVPSGDQLVAALGAALASAVAASTPA